MDSAELASTPGASTSNSHLTFPSQNGGQKTGTPPPAAPPVRELSKNRLYVGNLHSTINEYSLVQIFSKFGKVTKLDFLFHKSGPSKGKPRGYAFVEYQEAGEAQKAVSTLHERLIHGRKLVVTFASQAPMYDDGPYGAGRSHHHHRRTEQHRPTTLSLLKSSSNSGKTNDKIAAMEAKLRQMEKAKEPAPPSTLPTHPSLPLKPPPSILGPPAEESFPSSSSRRSTVGNQRPAQPKLKSSKPIGIFESGSSSSLGKKPTLEELMKSRQKNSTKIGILGK